MILHYPRLVKKIPKDVLIFDWHYSGGRLESLRFFKRHGYQVIATTSPIGCFLFLPRERSLKNQKNFVEDAYRAGVCGHLSTCWELTHGNHASVEYAYSLQAQLLASKKERHFFKYMDRDWWRAALALSRLAPMESLLRPDQKKESITQQCSAALTLETNPFSFLLKNSFWFDLRKVKIRLSQIRQWQAKVRCLKSWMPSGPLRTFSADLFSISQLIVLTLERILEWSQLKKAFESGNVGQLKRTLVKWEKDYSLLIKQYHQYEQREGYGTATRHRLIKARFYLKLWTKQLIQEVSRRTTRAIFEIFVDSLVPTRVVSYAFDRPIHLEDLR